MGFVKREPVQDLVILGDGEGQQEKVGGLLIGIPHDKGYDKDNYAILMSNGDVGIVSGSASLARQISPDDIDKFVLFEFTGWGKSPNGKFKAIEVHVWEGPLSEKMKAWPKAPAAEKEAPAAKPKEKAAAAKPKPIAPIGGGFDDDEPSQGDRARAAGIEDEDDDSLPF